MGCSEVKRRLKASGVVRSLPSSITSPLSESRRQRGRSSCRLCPIRLSSLDALCYQPLRADPPSILGVRARQTLQTLRVLRMGVRPSHLQRKPFASSPIHKPHSQDRSGTKAADRLLTEAGEHHSASRPEDLGGAEYPSRTVLGSHGDVRIGGSDHHCRLESVSGDLSQGL
jgi:hypothetical protein